MIGPVVAAVRDHVVTPQTLDTVPAERRLVLDPAAAPIDAAPQTVEVVAVSSTPMEAEIGGGVSVRHDVDVVVTVEHGDMAEAFRLRDLITTDLVLRAVAVDWPNVDWTPLEFDRTIAPTVRYAEGTTDSPDTLAAYAVLTFTVDATVRP